MTDWQTMDTAPKDRPILAVLWTDTQMVIEYDETNPLHPWSTLDGPSYHVSAPTHWMPLPELPKSL
jgi:hypothetical protein